MRKLLVLVAIAPALALAQRAPEGLAREARGLRAHSTLALHVPFRVPGCYATGARLGTKLEAVTITRASSRACPIAAGEITCTANQLCVTEKGALIEPQRVQLYPTPSAPAGGTVTFTATGAHVFWVEGAGSQQLSFGTATGTGLPCTATAASHCSFTVSTTGTATLAAVTGSLTRAQVEAGLVRSTFIASGTRNADAVTVPNPLKAWDASWCGEGTFTPHLWTWGAAGQDCHTFWATNTGTNSTYGGTVADTGRIYLNVGDGTNSRTRQLNGGFAASPATTRWSYAIQPPDLLLYRDGAPVAANATGGLGTGNWVPATAIQLGVNSGGCHLHGYLQDFKVYRTAACR